MHLTELYDWSMSDDRIECFWLEPMYLRRVRLRVFTFGTTKGEADHDDHVRCPAAGSWSSNSTTYYNGHDAWGPVVVEHEEAPYVMDEDGHGHWAARGEDWPADDPRWPVICEHCQQPFPDTAIRQTFDEPLYRRADGAEFTLRGAPPGAMWDANWYFRKGPDGLTLCVKTPGGDWIVDGRASNCGLPDDDVHYCWIRTGDPRIPGQVTVSKDGFTCAAGAGSIQAGNYHGFLRGGALVLT